VPSEQENSMASTEDRALSAKYVAVRQHTLDLSAPLSDEDCCVQSMPDASPVKWHMAHTTWFFETFILERFEPDFRPFHPAFRVLFNSYYNGVGDKHPRPQRGMLMRPSRGDVQAYRRNVDERIGILLQDCNTKLAALIETGLQHEQQHQELLLTDVKHLLSMNPTMPAYAKQAIHAVQHERRPLEWRRFDGGVVEIGHADHAGEGFFFDNETPRHRHFVAPFALASRLVTNGEYLEFIQQGGYSNPALWLSEGWDWVRANGLTQPIYWRQGEGDWAEFTLHGMQPLQPDAPAVHLSYFEADAYARWRGARLPTEAEWEHAATKGTEGFAQLFGAAWQWTSSSYAPYPGYAPAEGALGEYNGKFMVNQYVLRGSSSATPGGHSRISYRNFFPATARWQFSGIRLAKQSG
jgi:ergothioneine biosynthesis protein EgtB